MLSDRISWYTARGSRRDGRASCGQGHSMRIRAAFLLLMAAEVCLSFGIMPPGPLAAPGNQVGAKAATAPSAYVPPKGYVCYRASGPIKIDGRLDEAALQQVPWTDLFVDIARDG